MKTPKLRIYDGYYFKKGGDDIPMKVVFLPDLEKRIVWFEKELTEKWYNKCKGYEKECISCKFWKLFDSAFSEVMEK